MYPRAALHTTTANSTRNMAARVASHLCVRHWAHCVRQRCNARGLLQRRPRADNCSRLAPPLLWTSSCQDTHAAGNVECATFEKFCIAERATRNQKRTQLRVRKLVQSRSNLHQNGHEFNVKIRSILVYGMWSQAAEKWIASGRQNPYQILLRILYHNIGVCLVSKYKQ